MKTASGTSLTKLRVVTLAEAQALAQMSTSLFNNVHVSAGVSGGRNVSVNYSYQNDTSGAAPIVTDVA